LAFRRSNPSARSHPLDLWFSWEAPLPDFFCLIFLQVFDKMVRIRRRSLNLLNYGSSGSATLGQRETKFGNIFSKKNTAYREVSRILF
jgi:hypothetical protein